MLRSSSSVSGGSWSQVSSQGRRGTGCAGQARGTEVGEVRKKSRGEANGSKVDTGEAKRCVFRA